MNLRPFSIHNASRFMLIAVLMMGVVSCAPRGIAPSPDGVLKPAPEQRYPAEPAEKEPTPAREEADPRMVASLQLTQQGRSYVAKHQADSAIRVLERAVAIDPSNGQNYYYLSEAWLMKGDTVQAANFNELASIHLNSDQLWRLRIMDQKQRIKNQ